MEQSDGGIRGEIESEQTGAQRISCTCILALRKNRLAAASKGATFMYLLYFSSQTVEIIYMKN